LKNIVFAFGSVPKDGGTFTFYRNMRIPLLARGIDLRCITVGQREADLWEDDYADEGCVLLAENESSVKKQAKAFCRWCEENSVDIVMGVNSVAILSALPHLSPNIRMMSRCANAFDHGYRITVSCYERLNRIIALAPGQINDLVYFAREQRDNATEIFLQWYVNEQVEEESGVGTVIGKLKIAKDSPQALLMIDQELGTRVFTPPKE
jgi:hypothetical protein